MPAVLSGPIVALGINAQHTFSFLAPFQLEKLGMSADAAFQLSLENLDRITPRLVSTGNIRQAGLLHLLVTGHGMLTWQLYQSYAWQSVMPSSQIEPAKAGLM